MADPIQTEAPDAIHQLDDLLVAVGRLTVGDMRDNERVTAVWEAYRLLAQPANVHPEA